MRVEGNQITLTNAREDFKSLLILIRDQGQPVKARGELSYELEGATLVLEDPTDSFPVGVGLQVDPILAAKRALALIAGERVLTSTQIEDIVNAMLTEGYTRRALADVAEVAHPIDILAEHAEKLIAFHFLWRNETFRTHLYARSIDAVNDLAYLLFETAQLHLTLSGVMGSAKGAGPLMLHVSSLHILATDIGVSDRMRRPRLGTEPPELPIGINGTTWQEAQDKARHMLSSDQPQLDRLTAIEQRYLAMLNPPEPEDEATNE